MSRKYESFERDFLVHLGLSEFEKRRILQDIDDRLAKMPDEIITFPDDPYGFISPEFFQQLSAFWYVLQELRVFPLYIGLAQLAEIIGDFILGALFTHTPPAGNLEEVEHFNFSEMHRIEKRLQAFFDAYNPDHTYSADDENE